MNESLEIVGRSILIAFPDQDVADVPAKVDTGAYRTSIWASDIRVEDGLLKFCLFGEGSPFYSGEVLEFSDFDTVNVENSFGESEDRFTVVLPVAVGERVINASVSLADRSAKSYPVLIGRRMLRNRYLVDVTKAIKRQDQDGDDEE